MPSPTTFILVALMVATCGWLGAGSVRRWRRDEWVVVFTALVLSLSTWLLWPTERHLFEGQSFANVDMFKGYIPLVADLPWYLHPPFMRGMAAALGQLPGTQVEALLATAALFAWLWVSAVGVLALRVGSGLVGALVAVLLISLDPQRLFWGHAVYHVIHPAAFFTFGAVLFVESACAVDRPVSTAAAIGAGLLITLAIATRLELLAFLPSLLALVSLAGGRLRQPLLPAGASGLAAAALLYLTRRPSSGMTGYGWSVESAIEALASAGGCIQLLSPWSSPLAVLGLAVLLHRQVRHLWPLALAGAIAWLGLTTFGDVGARHMVMLRVLAAVSIGWAWARGPRWPRAGLLLVIIVLALSAADMRTHYFDAPAQPADDVISPPEMRRLLGADCVLVSHGSTSLYRNRRIPPLSLLDPSGVAVLWRRHRGCIVWMQGRDDFEWDETVRRVRRTRLEHLWSWERLGTYARPKEGLRPVLLLRGGGPAGLPEPRPRLLQLLWDVEPPPTPPVLQ